tara:strand:+ start:3147 stop:3989 length:843 start_codon:yes stop_codon:yes gene_type:complete
MAYGNEERQGDNQAFALRKAINDKFKERLSANQAFESMARGNQSLNLFEESEGARYLNMIKNNLNLTGKNENEEDDFSLSSDKRNWDDAPHIPIEEAFGLHNWPGLEFNPKNVMDGQYYHKIRTAIRGEGKMKALNLFVVSDEFQNDVSDKDKQKYYNLLDGMFVAEGMARMKHSAESHFFQSADMDKDYFMYGQFDEEGRAKGIKDRGTATQRHIELFKENLFKKDSYGRTLNELKEESAGANRLKHRKNFSFYEKAKEHQPEAIEFVNEVRQIIEGGK